MPSNWFIAVPTTAGAVSGTLDFSLAAPPKNPVPFKHPHHRKKASEKKFLSSIPLTAL
jgi:hypothetical protein